MLNNYVPCDQNLKDDNDDDDGDDDDGDDDDDDLVSAKTVQNQFFTKTDILTG